MKTILTLEIDHKKPIANLADLVAQRAYTLPGVDDVNAVGVASSGDMISLPVIEMPEEVVR